MADKLPLANRPAACSQPRWPAGGLDGLREKPPRQEMCLVGLGPFPSFCQEHHLHPEWEELMRST